MVRGRWYIGQIRVSVFFKHPVGIMMESIQIFTIFSSAIKGRGVIGIVHEKLVATHVMLIKCAFETKNYVWKLNYE